MTILGLDLSTSRTGTALLEKQGEGHYKLTRYSDIEHDDVIASFGAYPISFILALTSMADKIAALVESLKPDKIVIEETNSSKARYTQKSLEMLHCLVLQRLMNLGYTSDTIKYVSTGVWRARWASS
jgi:Holliday junction resolvasome RuvABC endonuclease subunit